MDVSVVIVNYNTRELLINTISSIVQYTRAVSYEIIVVDNDSEDGSLDRVKELFPEVITVQSNENIGFGRANNLGAQYASGEYLFLLNSDTLLVSDAISELYKYAVEHKTIGAVGARLLKADGVTPNLSWGYFPTPLSELRYIWSKLTRRSYGLAHGDEPFRVDFICGADLMIERSYYNELGGFDGNIFLYYEETDLQKRMADNKRERIILPGTEIIHLDGGSFGKSGLTYKRFCNSARSYNYYIRKHYKGVRYFAFRIFMCILRLELLLKRNWSLSERFQAYRIVLTGKTS